jgi:ubiquinone/menaquinone biosynthesis C-methylase UbiE
MPHNDAVESHYSHGELLEAIRSGVRQLGKTSETVSVEDLAPVDEFHIGGRIATETFLDQLDLATNDRVLDVGCGLGGASRFVAQRYGCRVTGIDLTDDYVRTGEVLCEWVGLGDLVSLDRGDATATPYEDGAFDKAFMLHVGMNIENKELLALEMFRLLRPGGRLGVYDVMRMGDGELRFPVPWATTSGESRVSTPATYRGTLEAAGFRVVAESDRSEFAMEFFTRLQEEEQGAESSPLGLHVLMGGSAPEKVRNMIENVYQGRVAPVEIIVEKPA